MSPSSGATEGWRQSRLETELEYVGGLLRFRIYPPSVPCSGPQCRKGKAGHSELPASTRLVRNSTAGSAIVPKAWLGRLPTLEWVHYLDDWSISWTTEPALPPPRQMH